MTPSGHVSVIPQIWSVSTPYRCLERLGHGARNGRAADYHLLERFGTLPGLIEMGEVHRPDRGHAPGEGDAFTRDQLVQARSVHPVAGQDDLGTANRGHERHAPGGGVVERRAGHHHVEGGESKSGIEACPHGMKHHGAMAVERALGIAGRPRCIAKEGSRSFVENRPGELVTARARAATRSTSASTAPGAWTSGAHIITKVRTVSSRGASRSTSASRLRSKNRIRLSAWSIVKASCSSDRRGLAVCSTAPMPVTPKNISRWRCVFQASVLTRSPLATPSRPSACASFADRAARPR